MSTWVTAYEAGQWAEYELGLLLIAVFILLIWLLVCRFKSQGLLRWSLAIVSSVTLMGLCLTSRVDALQISSLLTTGKNIEVLNGEYRYGEYHFPHSSRYGIDFREIHIGERILKLYHSGYLKHSRCYRNFYNSNQFSDNIELRLYIYWYEYELSHKSARVRLKTPCILKIEQRNIG
ncbi:hypothetical protein [Shewanella sp. MBTL60-007]|uniref:hypothetical protein n=1 Tax=Shewanella sp. MBTL60-007 TaxID=2815911 RepID=UPI001BC18A4C|nr:hypothetical protein [Shewanella sp. MBTL60-007]GIU15828.1 hypothetical protein TUM3792_08680 [Shewanella sp. MBTL60-007]